MNIHCSQCDKVDTPMVIDNNSCEDDKDVQTYISTMQCKFNLCQLCAMDEFFKRCPGCNVNMGTRHLCGMCKQWDDNGNYNKPYDGSPN